MDTHAAIVERPWSKSGTTSAKNSLMAFSVYVPFLHSAGRNRSNKKSYGMKPVFQFRSEASIAIALRNVFRDRSSFHKYTSLPKPIYHDITETQKIGHRTHPPVSKVLSKISHIRFIPRDAAY